MLFLRTTAHPDFAVSHDHPHFAHGYVRGTQDWMNTNKDVLAKTVACVTIEYLGATRWVDDPDNNEYKPVRQFEWGPAFTPIRAEGSVFLKAAQAPRRKTSTPLILLEAIPAKARVSGAPESR
jgi:hypothetical protein